MKTCKGCVYEADKKNIQFDGYITWSLPNNHPCFDCKRFPREPQKFPDNYRQLKVTE